MASVRWRDLPMDSDDENRAERYQQYEQTLMYGQYTRELSNFAKWEAKKMKTNEPPRVHVASECCSLFGRFWKFSFGRVGEDWVFLAVLGILMAWVSCAMDFSIAVCNKGSGIPEMKTILRGVVLKEYLTFKTLVAKVIGLTATLGSGLPLGKEGPFVHIASIVATLLSKAVTSFKVIYENESRHYEMLAAACAVGVACSFGAPIGGVLFSIEVTTVYFAVRNYWRGFFAAVCGAVMFRLLAVWFNEEGTLTAMFRTSFTSYAFDPMELFAFAITGIVCGFLGAFFVWVHRQYVTFMRRNRRMKAFFQKSRLLYPFLVTVLYGTLSFPPWFGQFVAGELTTHSQVVELFTNTSWLKENPTVPEFQIIAHWRTPWSNVLVNLFLYVTFTFCGTVVASTLPVPSGIFIPVFKMGAALGRIVGECMAAVFPSGLKYGGRTNMIVPGGYSIVGAAAFASSVTHTISSAVIVFELTGQITHIIPVMMAVLIANGIAQMLQPSVYDSIIRIKKLPYLPDILTSTSRAYRIFVEDFMIRDVKYIWYGITYRQLKNVLIINKKIRAFPLVDSPDSMVLLGSIERTQLIAIIEDLFGLDKRTNVVGKWKNAANQALKRDSDNEGEKPKEANSIPGIDKDAAPARCKNVLAATADFFRNFSTFSKEENCPDRGLTDPLLVSPEETGCRPIRRASSVEALDFSKISSPASEKRRKLSRFEVTKVVSPPSVILQVDPLQVNPLGNNEASPQREVLPRKSILKKTQSVILQPLPDSPLASILTTPYATVHAGDSRLRQAIEVVMRKRKLPKMDHNMPILSEITSTILLERAKERQRQLMEQELDKKADFQKCQIDPAPFQLVERTSLLKVHSLFSMLSLDHAYVTAIGRLIGVVALKELRRAIEETNLGEFSKSGEGDDVEKVSSSGK